MISSENPQILPTWCKATAEAKVLPENPQTGYTCQTINCLYTIIQWKSISISNDSYSQTHWVQFVTNNSVNFLQHLICNIKFMSYLSKK